MNNSQKSNNGFFNGFILGVIIGAACALLLVTKRGRKILSIISEEGFSGIESLLEDDEEVKKKPVQKTSNEIRDTMSTMRVESIEEIPFQEEVTVESYPSIEKMAPRRFFRGIRKKIHSIN